MALLDPPGSSISDLLLARARPNTRLVHSFGLQNTFVSADIVVRKQFITRAREVLRQHTRNFPAFPEVVRGVVAGSAHRLGSPSRRPSIPFAIFIQVVTLRVVVGSLLGGDIPEDDDEGTVFVVGAINDLWALSKKHGTTPPPSALLDSVNTYLRTWIPERYERPLDFVIPAYETMWRVVAVTVARAIHDRGACAAFSAFLDSPREDQFARFEDARPQQPSVEAFICEVLRLHPPSGRLARATPSRVGVLLWAPVTTHVANIEALHQDTAIWGSDAGVFDPMRFHGSRLSYGQKHAFIPFSHGPLRCVAFKEAPRFAAIVAAAVLEIVSASEARYRLVCGERIGRREGWEGWSIEVRDR
ncbi:cytochrome P450 [Lactarius hatsudake]|nr:cytochrome P450 [Lactarius hatsudake]